MISEKWQSNSGDMIELDHFYNGLCDYGVVVKHALEGKSTKKEEKQRTELVISLGRRAGYLGRLITELTGLKTVNASGEYDMWMVALKIPPDKLAYSAIRDCIQVTNRAIGQLVDDIRKGIRDEQGNLLNKTQGILTEPPKVFIAHGGKSEARDKLCSFLSALGVIPLVIEKEPKEGRSVNQQVEYCLEQADCSIVLGTADDKELKDGKLYPRRNVHVEIGRFQERFPRRIIYLLEEGASFPSNISEKLYTRFSQQSMDEAFISVARELKAFGLLKAVKPETKE